METAKMQEIIVKWLNEHPYLSQNALCKEVGIDRGNFFRTVKTGLPALREDVIKKIVKVISRYGFKMPEPKVRSPKSKGLPLPADYIVPKSIEIIDGAGNKTPIVSLKDLNKSAKPKVVTAPPPKSNYSINTKPGSSKADRLRDLKGRK